MVQLNQTPLVNIRILSKSNFYWARRWGVIEVQWAGLNFNTTVKGRFLSFLVSSYFFLKLCLVDLSGSWLVLWFIFLYLSRFLSWFGLLFVIFWLLSNSNWRWWDLVRGYKSIRYNREVSGVLIFFLNWLWFFLLWRLRSFNFLFWGFNWGRFDLFWLS